MPTAVHITANIIQVELVVPFNLVNLMCVPRNIINKTNNHNYMYNQFEDKLWLNKFSNIYQNIEKFPEESFCSGNVIHRNNNGNKIFKQLKVHYLMPQYHTICEILWRKGAGGHVRFSEDISFARYRDDNISVGVHSGNNNNEYCLYFMKNDKIIGANNLNLFVDSLTKHDATFSNGDVKLDFKNFDYLFALSSIRCDCDNGLKTENGSGFQFKVSFCQSVYST